MTVILSGTLMRFSSYQREIPVKGATVKLALIDLCEKHPALLKVLFDGNGAIRSSHQVFVNAEQISRTDLDDQAVSGDDVIEVLTAIAGG